MLEEAVKSAIYEDMLKQLFESVAERAERGVFRIVVRYGPKWSGGSGFFVSESRFLTCFHVVFGSGLGVLRADPAFQVVQGSTEHERLQAYINGLNPDIQVYLHDGSRVTGKIEGFSEKYDVALLSVKMGHKVVVPPRIAWDAQSTRGERIFFGGYPNHHSYGVDDSPFAVHEGMISSITKTEIGGEAYEHLQIDSINLGGNSGAPLFDAKAKKVIGIINGTHNWGNDHLLSMPPGTTVPTKISLRTPLSIAYATQLKTIKEEAGLPLD